MMGGFISCSETTSTDAETGTLRMVLVDAPADLEGVESLEIVFDRVMVHRGICQDEDSTDGWITVLSDTLPVEQRTFDLIELVNGDFGIICEDDLEAGAYTQIRIIIESATLVVDGEPQDLFIPSGEQSGIKLVGGFKVDPGVITALTLDFDVAKSLHEAPPGSGRYILRPTIRLTQTTLSGTISGTVLPAGIGSVIYALDPSTVDTVASTLADPVTGEYVLQALLAGIYDVRASAVGYTDSTRTGIAVTAGVNTPDVDFELIPSGI
ncbi:MAG: DUF4382 domain-containing protein [Candidatus Krumholzibacteria bacterium]|nr:DUF4382 domain-containing protein [Candidatus Krumholzibacteria bacterium]